MKNITRLSAFLFALLIPVFCKADMPGAGFYAVGLLFFLAIIGLIVFLVVYLTKRKK